MQPLLKRHALIDSLQLVMQNEAVRLQTEEHQDPVHLPKKYPKARPTARPTAQQVATILLLLVIALLLYCLNSSLQQVVQSNQQLQQAVEKGSDHKDVLQSVQTIAQVQNSEVASLQLQAGMRQREIQLLQEINFHEKTHSDQLHRIVEGQKEQTQQLQRQTEGSTWFDHRVSYQHKHERLTFNYSTLGQPTPNEQFDFTPLTQEDLYGFEKQVAAWLRPYNDTNCKYKRIGPSRDGGYVVCENFISKSEGLLNLGIQNIDDFGCQFSSYKKIPNYMYDCTSSIKPFCALNDDKNKFYHTCVGDITEYQTKSFETLKDMVDKNGLKGKHISIKIDVEGAEMVAFRHFPTSYLDHIDQIVMEYHPADQWLQGDEKTQAYGFNHAKFKGNLQIWKTISEHFYCVNWHHTTNGCYNQPDQRERDLANQHWFRSSTLQLSFVNKKLLTINKPTRSFAWPHNENLPNYPHYPELRPDSPTHTCDYSKDDDPDPTQ